MSSRPLCEFEPFPNEAVEQSIPDRFEQQVGLHPDRLAVKTRSHALTYSALNHHANRVAHAILTRRGEGEEPIALLLDQGAPLVAAILGVLKAGKLYVPVDPRYPPARIDSMLVDSQAGLIVTDQNNHALALSLAAGERSILRADALEPEFSGEYGGVPLSPGTLAYLFYTSGSTGQPKGVVDCHRNVLHNVMRYTNGLRINAEDRLSLVQSCTFSGSVSSLFGALLNGAAVFPFDLASEGASRLADWLNEEKITIYHSVPAIFRQVPREGVQFPYLRCIRLEGDQATIGDVALFQRYFKPDCLLVNGLGTTETGIVRRYFIDRETRITGGTVPVGHSVDDMEILLLDEAGEEVGENEIGEIAVRSSYLAVGYWRRPGLTAAAFAPDPTGGDRRTYLTGDLGRMRPDGCLEHLGRKDFQAKIDGQWIEFAAVEAALLGLESVREAVVVTREDRSGEPRPVAYLVPAASPPPTVSSLRRALARTLPAHTLPAAFVILEALPLTPSGKLDRLRLPPPDRGRPSIDTPFAEPRTPVEVVMTQIWEELLALEGIGVDDDFLELGGNSLLATQLLSRLRTMFQVTLTLHQFFENRTVAGLVELLLHNESSPGRVAATARLRQKVNEMSAEEVHAMLQD